MGNQMPDDNVSIKSMDRMITIALCLLVALLGGIIAIEARLEARLDYAEGMVAAWANRLGAAKDDNGNWKKWPADTLPENDPWGHPLRVRYEKGKYSEQVVVSSDGPDGRQWSRDDLQETASYIHWIEAAKDSAEAVEEVAGAATRGVVGGAIEGVTDHLPKQVRDKLGIPSERDKPKKEEEKN